MANPAPAHSVADVRQWEVWKVYREHEDGTGKGRPALAISTSEKNQARGYAWFIKITGEDHPEVPCRLRLDKQSPHFRHTGLVETSWIHVLDEKKITPDRLLEKWGEVGPFTRAYLLMRLPKISEAFKE